MLVFCRRYCKLSASKKAVVTAQKGLHLNTFFMFFSWLHHSRQVLARCLRHKFLCLQRYKAFLIGTMQMFCHVVTTI